MRKRYFLLVLFLTVSIITKSQDFKIYFQKNRYNVEHFENMDYGYYQFVGYEYVDREKKDIIDHEAVKQRIIELYPNEDDTGFLSLDIENRLYLDLRKKSKSVRKAAVKEFVKIVEVVKALRPNVKIGVYGIPLKFNYDFQKEQNFFRELKPLLKKVDYISPDIYFSFSESEQNEERFLRNLDDNLTLFMDWSTRVNKPLYPYVWYLIHPYNKKFGGKPISDERMSLLLSRIKSFRYKGQAISGVLWWESWGTIQANTKESLTDNIMPFRSFFPKNVDE